MLSLSTEDAMVKMEKHAGRAWFAACYFKLKARRLMHKTSPMPVQTFWEFYSLGK